MVVRLFITNHRTGTGYVCVVLCYSTVLYTLNTETQKGDIKTGARPLSPYLEQHKGKEEEEEEEE